MKHPACTSIPNNQRDFPVQIDPPTSSLVADLHKSTVQYWRGCSTISYIRTTCPKEFHSFILPSERTAVLSNNRLCCKARLDRQRAPSALAADQTVGIVAHAASGDIRGMAHRTGHLAHQCRPDARSRDQLAPCVLTSRCGRKEGRMSAAAQPESEINHVRAT